MSWFFVPLAAGYLLVRLDRLQLREAIQTTLRRWGAKLTLVFEREHAGHILHAIDLARVSARVPAPD